MAATGNASTVALAEALAIQPFVSVTVTEYAPVVVTIIL
jgi:protein involved in polysaccharide export with SLBB domain